MKLEWKTCFKIGISALILYICIHFLPSVADIISKFFGAAFPLFVGCAIAYVINILMMFYERHYFPNAQNKALIKSRRPVCMICATLTLLAIIALVIGLVLPQLISCITLIVEKAPSGIKKIATNITKLDFLPQSVVSFINSIDWKSTIDKITDFLTSGIGNVMNVVISTVTSVFSGVVTAFIGIIFAFYILVSKDRITVQFKRLMRCYFKVKTRRRFTYLLSVIDDCFHRYIVGQCTEAVILGTLCMIGMFILRLPYAPMIGALIAFTALIPIAGAYIGACVGAFLILMDSPVKALIFIIFIVVLQQFEGNVIYPRVVGSSLGLPGIWVLAAITVGGGVMGVTGMLIGVPITATIYRIVRDDLNNRTLGTGNEPLFSKKQ